ncbi:COG1470 family protein [Streptomyces sp. NPDC003952]
MTPSAAPSGPRTPGLDIPAVSVTPGDIASTTLTIRNDSDIVEAYGLTVVGDGAAWTTVEPERLSLYPGTSETVTLRLAPPRSPEIRAGEMPLGVRVLPTEHPESVTVLETVVSVGEFHDVRTQLSPRRRRGWLRGRYLLAVRNQGNAPVRVAFTPGQAGEELAFAFALAEPALEPGESKEVRLRVRTSRPVWLGAPVVWPFTVDTRETGEPAEAEDRPGGSFAAPALDAEFVQIPVFPKWLLALLAALIALLIAWFALVRPAVRSAAEEAATSAVQPRPVPTESASDEASSGTGGAGKSSGGSSQKPGTAPGGGGGASTGGGTSGDGTATGAGRQSSATVDLKTGRGQSKSGAYTVPEKSVFGITDVVVANFQGDEGVMTITFGDRKITTIALETFRNQDYHWVTPIRIGEKSTVTIDVTCTKPGTPATGQQARECHEVVNVSGVLSSTD